jgi:hypothetical protein
MLGRVTSLSSVLLVVLLALAGSASAAPAKLDWGKQVNAGACKTKGEPVVNVGFKVVNAVDSGFGGYWAFENYNRRTQLWRMAEDKYCAVVRYQGNFAGVAGQQSPANAESLDGDEVGTFHGGYRAVITGDLLAKPNWPTHGWVGTFDYDCTITANCPGSVNWITQYFEPGSGFAYSWWGWIYRGGRYGTWVNSSDGSTGDIS